MRFTRAVISALGVAGFAATLPAQALVYTYPIVPLYQLYHYGNTDRFYTTLESDRDLAMGFYGYAYEGVAAFVESSAVRAGAAKPFNRYFVDWPLLEHFYTISAAEHAAVLSYGYVHEGVEGYVYESPVSGTAPLHRLAYFDGSTSALQHIYTTSERNRDILAATGWGYDGVAGYVWAVPEPTANASVSYGYNPDTCPLLGSCQTASRHAIIFIPSVTDFTSIVRQGYCDGSATVYRDNQVIERISRLNWTYGATPGTWSSTYGCYYQMLWPLGGTPGYHEIRIEFTGYTAFIGQYPWSAGSWVTRPPSTYRSMQYFYP